MTSQGRSAGSVVCMVLAMLSMLAAVIMVAVAMTAASHVSDVPPSHSTSGANPLFEDPKCDEQSSSPPDQLFFSCLSESELAAQEDAATWQAEIAARRADAEGKGDLAIIFGLLGVTFAVCAVALKTGGRAVPQIAARPAWTPSPAAGQGSMPNSRPFPDAQQPGPG